MPEIHDPGMRLHSSGGEVAYFMLADQDNFDDTTTYYGYVSAEGRFYLVKAVTSGTTITYTYRKGLKSETYATVWANRTSETFHTFPVEFA